MKPESVMIVEQDTDLRSTLRSAFEQRGYLTWTCMAPEMAVSIFPAVMPNIVIVELGDQEARTLSLIAAWTKACPHTRIIVQSTSGDAEQVRRAMEHGAHAFLTKPFALQPLFDMVEKDIPPPPVVVMPTADAA